MKNLLKVAAVAVLSLGFGVAAQAQSDDARIVASAKVVDVLTVTAGAELEFGQVMKGANKYIAPTGDAASSDPSGVVGDGAAGFFKLFAGDGSSVTLNIELEPLTHSNGTNTLEIVFNENQDGDKDIISLGYGTAAGDLTKLVLGSNTISDFPDTKIDDNKNGTIVWVGATVKASNDQLSGTYTGAIKLTASYN